MNEKRRKKIRAYLINFVNEELKRNKKKKKEDILINSVSLDILSRKNMQSKLFLGKEDNYYYQQNVEIGWMVGVNFDINNSYHQKPLIDIFANKVTKEINRVDSSDIGEEKIEIVNKETIIKKNLDRILYIHQDRSNINSLGTSLFLKKEISERKFNKEKANNISGRISNFSLNKSKMEKGEKHTKTISNHSIIDENSILLKRYSNITLETELSRIIRCCHDEDYSSSQENCISDSRRSEINRELKIAKMYAKRLNLYCKKLKKKVSTKYLKNKKKEKNDNQDKKICKQAAKKGNNNGSCELDRNKGNSHKIKRIEFKKILIKKNMDKDNNISKFNIIEKKSQTNKGKNDSDKNNFLESSAHIKGNITSRENPNNTKKGLLRSNQIKKRHSSTFRTKLMTKLKQVYFKSPKKADIFKREKSKQIEDKVYKKININQKMNNALNSNKKEEQIVKLIKIKKKPEHKNEKNSTFRINNIKYGKRSSMMEKMNNTGLEKINFFKNKTKSSYVPYTIKATKKKLKKKREKINNINNNNSTTTISQRKDTSGSSENNGNENDNRKNNSKIKISKKNSSQLIKGKKGFLSIENLKKMKKRRSSNYDKVKIHKLKRISPLKIEREKRNNTTEKNEKKFGKRNDINDVEITDFDDFNLIDEFLYQRKLKRSKINNVLGMN